MYCLFIMRQVIFCLSTLEKSPVYGVLYSNLHTRLAIVTENELGLAFPPRNLPNKFRPDPSTFYLVIVVTNRHTKRQTDRQTNAGKNIIPRFRGDNENSKAEYKLQHKQPSMHTHMLSHQQKHRQNTQRYWYKD